jgi:hypothetical protein
VLCSRSFVVIALGISMMGCYSLQPLMGPVPVGGPNELGLSINDAGRSALSPLMGPEISQIRGRLLDTVNQEYVVAVSSIQTFRAGEQIWSGEKVRIKPEFVYQTQERRFSKARTITACVAGAGALVFLAKNYAAGVFFPGDDTPDPGDTSSSRRIPLRLPLRLPR